MQKIIETENLTKYYSKNVIGIKDLNISVEQGEIYGFLGSNGAGKTTTIRVLLNLIYPTSGNGKIFGKDIIGDHLAITKKIGYIPSAIKPYKNLTGQDFLRYAAKYYHIKDNKRRQTLLDAFTMSEKDLNRKIRDYSSGMGRKIAIIQAFEHKPDLIIMDEPTEGLDPVMQHTFYALLKEYRDEGGTVFISSHHLREVERVCDRAAIIRKGKLVKVEKVKDLMSSGSKKINIVFADKVQSNELDIPELKIEEFDGQRLFGTVTGNIDKVIKKLAGYKILDISLPPRSLEDVFLHYYTDEEGAE
ncbi:MAG: ABC transporter ATP-binding protein [Acidobacteria bacterium]|nr:ABC transporter ATP-binding protein [Acidobacteriota bacterium]